MGELRCWNHLRAGTGQLRRNALEDYASRRHPRERECAIPGRIFQSVQSSAVQQSSEQPGERELRADYEQLGEPTSDPTRVEIHLLGFAACGAAIRSVRGKICGRFGRPIISHFRTWSRTISFRPAFLTA